jgi:predicted phosphodiesterase
VLKKKAQVILLASTLLLGSCAYTGKSKTFVPLLEKPGIHEIQKGLEGIIKSNSQVIQELEQKQKKEWLRFVVIGDTISDQNLVYRNLLAKISQLDPHPEFIINTGDFSAGNPKAYSYYFDTIKNYPHPIMHIAGNHELDYGGERIYRAVFGEADFFFDYNDIRLIFMGVKSHGLTSQRLEWLEDRLEEDYPAKKIFLTHEFPLEPFKELFPGAYSLFVHRRQNEEKLLDLLDKYNVTMAFFGHLHRHYEKIYQETIMIITGGGGQRNSLEPRANQPLSTKQKHYTLVDLLAVKGEEPQGVITCINKDGKPLFMNSFYVEEEGTGSTGSNGNSSENSIQLVTYNPSDTNLKHPPYLGEIYDAYVKKTIQRKKIKEQEEGTD